MTRVMSQGHDKSAAIAICHASIVKRKERREARLISLKAPNYGARAGQTIAGNLARGAGGKFVRGDGSAASGREVVNALTAKPKRGASGKPKRSDAEQDATAAKVGVDASDAKALRDFAKGGALDDATAAKLESAGLVERGKDGTPRLASAGRSLARAMQSGDERAAADALSKARDSKTAQREREAKRGEREAAQAGKRAAAESKRNERAARVEQQRQERQSKRRDAEMQKATDRLEEIEAVTSSDENVTEAERVKRINQLDALDKRLDAAGGNDELATKIDDLRERLGGQRKRAKPVAAHKAFAVFKQANGAWRWVTRSSNAYADRDREIVSAKALDTDTARMQEGGAYGPLRFWHVGDVGYETPLDWRTSFAGTGLDLGATDFSAMDGRMLVESGTFKDGAPVEAIASNADAWQVSIGFTHPPNEPDASGVYHNIRVFERSLLPRGKAANPFTGLSVSKSGGQDMASLKEKWGDFVALFGDEAKAKEFAAQTAEKQKEIEAAGVAFKEGEAVAETSESHTNAEAAPATETKADGDEAEAEGEADAVFVGDMLADEFAAMLTKSIAEALAPMMTAQAEMSQRVEGAEAATKEARALAAKAGELLVTQKQAADASITALDARVKELEGDAPGQRAGYRPTQDGATITQKQMKAPQSADDLSRMAALLFGDKAEQGA